MTWLESLACEWAVLYPCVMKVLPLLIVSEVLLARITLEFDLVEDLVLEDLLLALLVLAFAHWTFPGVTLMDAIVAVHSLAGVAHAHIYDDMEADRTLKFCCELAIN